MKITGKEIAAKIYEDLQNRVGELKKKNNLPAGRQVTPHLTVILVGDDPASVAYVNQKLKWGEFIGAKITIDRFPVSVTFTELTNKIKTLNNDPAVHAILIQRPLPPQIDPHKLELLVSPQKDIDGFHPSSAYTFPLPLAVIKILEEVHKLKINRGVASVGLPIERLESAKPRTKPSDWENARQAPDNLVSWLKTQKIVVLGKGPTGGGPILKYFTKLNLDPTLIDSKTPNPGKLLKQADIIISAVGKPGIITSGQIKKGVILISVGIFRGEDGKLHGDYSESDIENKAAFFTPTPGGVGPVNVAMLMDNLVTAAEKQTQ